jgi:hypothetical protein
LNSKFRVPSENVCVPNENIPVPSENVPVLRWNDGVVKAIALVQMIKSDAIA